MYKISEQHTIITTGHIHTIHTTTQDAVDDSARTQVKALKEKMVLLKNNITTSQDTKYHRY
jgi:hypothetical protein